MSNSSSTGVFSKLKHRRNKEYWWSKAIRYLHYKLVIPIQREKDSPHLIAYSVMIGLFVGFTPSVGIQIPLLIAIWWIAKTVFKFNFSVIIAIAWSWFSNAATMIPLYYVFYSTGRLIMPTDEDDFSFEDFSNYISSNLSEEASIAESFEFLIDLIELVGSSLLIGSLPWAVGLGLLGYWLSLRATLSYQRYRKERILKKLKDKNDAE